MKPIYLDAHATTPCDPRVIEAMAPCFGVAFGNASSQTHAFGWEAEALVERAREYVAELVGAGPTEIVFTSGATESNNLASKGLLQDALIGGVRFHAVTSAIEHHSVLDPLRRLEKEQGLELSVVPVNGEGRVDPAAVEAAMTPETRLVSIMWANNEIGAIQPIAEIGAICKRRGVFFHCDAAQALAWLPCDVNALGVDLMSISGHKMYGPKGVGALYLRRRNPRVLPRPLMDGGGQERGLRPGTLNTPGIVGLGEAARIARAEREEAAARVGALRDRMLERLRAGLPGLRVNGGLDQRLPNNLNISIEGVSADALMMAMTDVAVSSGSACASEEPGPSYVLRALGLEDERAYQSIRIGLSRFTTEEEIERAAGRIIETARNF